MMPTTCAAYGCNNEFRKGGNVRFFRFPCEKFHAMKRKLWITAVKHSNMENKLWSPGKACRICSDHFVSGKPSKFNSHPDFVPSVFVYKKVGRTSLNRFECPRNRQKYPGIEQADFGNSTIPEADNLDFHGAHHNSVNMFYGSEMDNFILPDAKIQDFDTGQVYIKIEPNDESEVATSQYDLIPSKTDPVPKIKREFTDLDTSLVTFQTKEEPESLVSPHSENDCKPCPTDDFTLVEEESEPPHFDCPSIVLEQNMETLDIDMVFEDHGTTYPQGYLDAQRDIFGSGEIGLNKNLPASDTRMAGETITVAEDHSNPSYDAGCKEDKSQRIMLQGNAASQNSNNGWVQKNHLNVESQSMVQSYARSMTTFKCLDSLEEQLRNQKGSIYNCGQCNKRFGNISILKSHLEMHTEFFKNSREQNQNRSPELSLNDSPQEQAPTTSAQVTVNHKCTKCEMVFAKKDLLRKHVSTHVIKKKHKCSHCGMVFRRRRNWNKHILIHSDVKPFKCSHCEKAFARRKFLASHILTHTQQKTHRCNFCGKSFTKITVLNNHILTHSGLKPHICSFCEKAFTVIKSLKRHLLQHSEKNKLKCTRCEKIFFHKARLEKHLKTHTIGRPHKCSQCKMGYYKKEHLEKHIMKHTVGKPYLCNKCGKAFAASSTLRTHLLGVHSEVKAYTCTVCAKAFSWGGLLRKHMLTHGSERPHKCTVCGKAFNQIIYLKRHFLIHTGEKPYQCTFCGKAFIQKKGLNAHILTHSKDLP